MNIAVICAAGKGKRMKAKTPKALLKLKNKPLFIHALIALNQPEIKHFLILAPKKHLAEFEIAVKKQLPARLKRKILAIIPGGKERQYSIEKGLDFLEKQGFNSKDIVLVHNASNLFITRQDIQKLLRTIKKGAAAGLALPSNDTLRECNSRKKPLKTLNRANIWRMQTPQGASLEVMLKAYQQARKINFFGTDDLALIEKLKYPIRLVESNQLNFKITYPEDLKIAEALLGMKCSN